MPNSHLLIRVTPFLMVALWSTAYIGTKISLFYGEPLTLIMWRCLLTGSAMLSVCIVMRVPWPRDLKTIAITAVIGILINVGFLGGSYLAIERQVSPGVVSLVTGMQPLLTAVIAAPFLGERAGPRQYLGLVVGFAGVVLVMLNKIDLGSVQLYGAGFAVVALVGITLATLLQKRFVSDLDLRTGMTIQFLSATLVLGVLASGLETMDVQVTSGFIMVTVWLSFGVSIGAVALTYQMIRRDEVAKVVSLFYLVPPVVAVIGHFLFEETYNIYSIIGMLVALTGVFIVMRS